MEYTVKVSGVKDVEALDRALTSLESVLASAKGSGKGLEEVRKIITGFKGQASVFQELAASIKNFDSGFDKVTGSIAANTKELNRTMVREFAMLSQTMQTALMSGGIGGPEATKKVAKKVSATVSDGFEEGTKEGTKKVKEIARQARDEMTAAYQVLVGGDAYKKVSNPAELARLKELQSLGARISNYHKRQLSEQKAYEDKLISNTKDAATRMRKESTALYNAMVGSDPRKPVRNDAEYERLKELRASGASLSAYHKQQLQAYEAVNSAKKLAEQKALEAQEALLVKQAAQVKEKQAVHLKDLNNLTKYYQQEDKLQKNAIKERIESLNMTAKLAKQEAAIRDEENRKALAASEEAHRNLIRDLNNRVKFARQRQQWLEDIQASVRQASKRSDGAYSSLFTTDIQGSDAQIKRYNRMVKDAAAEARKRDEEAQAEITKRQESEQAAHQAHMQMLTATARFRAQEAEREAKEYKEKLRKEESLLNIKKEAIDIGRREYAELLKGRGGSAELGRSDLERLNGITSQGGTSFIAPAHLLALKEYRKSLEETIPAGDKAGKTLRDLRNQSNDAHSAVRGLASGFNLLWLTWGSLVPLMAGAAISNGFMKAAKEGMEVGHTLQIIKSLGGATSDEIDNLHGKILELGSTSIHGPIAVSEAMKTLVLAGQSASEALKSIDPVLNFSIAGTTDIQTAADVLVSVTTAFGTGAEGFRKTADIIVRAAADSKASVESFGEAMKTASVVGEQYGATQEDVAALISLLANLGIQGSAAGTAIRNMYADLSGRNMKVSKLLKQFGLDFRNAKGEMLSLAETTDILAKKLATLSPKAAGDLLQNLLSERGGKAMIAALSEYYKAALDGEGATNALEARIKTLNETMGDSALAAAQMSTTTKSQWQMVGASLETALERVFKNMEPQLTVMAKSLQDLFNNPAFVAGVTAFTTAIANLGSAVGSHIGVITAAVSAYGTYRLAMLAVVAGKSALSGSLTRLITLKSSAQRAAVLTSVAYGRWKQATDAVTVSTAAAEAATIRKNRAVKAAVSSAGTFIAAGSRLLGALSGVGMALTIGVSLWDAYRMAKERASGAVPTVSAGLSDVTESVLADARKASAEAEAARMAAERGDDVDLSVKQSNLERHFEETTAATRQAAQDAENDLWQITHKLEDAKKRMAAGALWTTNPGGLRTDMAGYVRELEAQRAEVTKNLNSLNGTLQREESAKEEIERLHKKTAEDTLTKESIEETRRENQALEAYVAIAAKSNISREAAIAQYKKMQEGGGLDFGDRGFKPSATLGYVDSDFEHVSRLIEAQKGEYKALYDAGIISANTYYDNVMYKEGELYKTKKAALERKIAEYSKDPKDIRAKKDAEVAKAELAALESQYRNTTMGLGNEKGKKAAEDEALKRVGELYGKEYEARLRHESDMEVLKLTMSQRDFEIYQAQFKVKEDFLKKEQELKRKFEEDSAGKGEVETARLKEALNRQLEDLKAHEQASLQIVMDSEARKQRARESSTAGYKRAYADLHQAAYDFNAQTYSLTTNFYSGMADAMTNFAMTGKLSFSDLARSIVSEMVKIAMMRMVLGLVGMLGGGMSGGGLSTASPGAATSSSLGNVGSTNYSLSSGNSGLGLQMNAKGGVYSSPSLSTYSNEVHSSPKLFAFAKGAGVFGEAGPEAIMPLTRGPDGNLGVRNFGEGSGGGTSVETNVYLEIINNGSPVSANMESGRDEQGNVIKRIILDTINEDIGKGGKTAKTISRRFKLA